MNSKSFVKMVKVLVVVTLNTKICGGFNQFGPSLIRNEKCPDR